MKGKLLVNNGAGVVVINIADIILFETRNRKISMLYKCGGREQRMEFPESLVNLGGRLEGLGFVQIHKSFLVSLDYLEGIQNGYVHMGDCGKTKIPVGRIYMSKLMDKVIKGAEIMI